MIAGMWMTDNYDRIVIVLCHLGFLMYKKNKLIFMKKWGNINMVFTIAGGLHIASRRDVSNMRIFFLCKNIPTYPSPSKQIKAAKLRNDTVREIYFLDRYNSCLYSILQSY